MPLLRNQTQQFQHREALTVNYIELFGTAMSIIVAVSLTQKNIKWLRILNLIGAFGFSVYGILIKSWPVAGLNGFISVIDIWYLTEMFIRRDRFSHIFCCPSEDPYCRQFLLFYKDDIKKYQPDLPEGFGPETTGCIILRNMIPVSLIIFRLIKEDTAEILIDYATPSFRDFKNGRYFLEKVVHREALSSVNRIQTCSGTKKHETYLKRMGYFKKKREEGWLWILEI